MIVVSAILTNDLSNFKKQLKIVEKFAPYAQIDVMDKKFVPGFSFDLKLSAVQLKKEVKTKLPLELHLMVASPLEYLKKWRGVKNIFRVVFHVESADAPGKVIAAAKKLGWEVGIALNPNTPVSKIKPHLNGVGLVLFMTVVPGKQGQKFLPQVGKKIAMFKAYSLKLKALPTLAIDGGINETNIQQVKKWGIQIFNIGSALMKTKNPKNEYEKLRKIIK